MNNTTIKLALLQLNQTVPQVTGEITETCRDWCVGEHFRFQHNEIVQALFIIPVILVSISIANTLLDNPEKSFILKRIPYINKPEHEEKRVQIARVFLSLASWMMSLFTCWIIYELLLGFLKL